MEPRQGFLAGLIDPDEALAALQLVFPQRRRDGTRSTLPGTPHQRQVSLVHGTRAQLLMQGAQCAAPLGDNQATRGIPVKPVNQFKVMGIRAHGAQRLDDTVTDAAAAMNRNAGGFVDHQDVGIFK